MTRPLWIIKNLKIQLHGIPYVTTFIVLQNNVVEMKSENEQNWVTWNGWKLDKPRWQGGRRNK
jgi:hypothetical protein